MLYVQGEGFCRHQQVSHIENEKGNKGEKREEESRLKKVHTGTVLYGTVQ